MKLRAILESVDASCVTSTSAVAPVLSPIRLRSQRVKTLRKRKIPITESLWARFDKSTALLYQVDSTIITEAAVEDDDEMKSHVDAINAQVDNALRQSEVDHPTEISVFGLQDDSGNVIKVTVARSDGPDFENALANLLADNESGKEVAEIIYILQQQFEVLDVDWNQEIEGDEEPIVEADGDDEQPLDSEPSVELPTEDGDAEATELPDVTDADELTPEEPPVDTASTIDLIQSVIDLLKQETEARAASVAVDKAKAESELADVEHNKLNQEIAQHQEIADMEQSEEIEREETKQNRLVARLAKFRAAHQPTTPAPQQ